MKDFSLCHWNSPGKDTNQKDARKPLRDANNVKWSPLNSSNRSKPSPSSSKANGKSTKLSKWYLRAGKESRLEFEGAFQHFTNTKRYMSDYRERKMTRVHEEYADDIQSYMAMQQSSEDGLLFTQSLLGTMNATNRQPSNHFHDPSLRDTTFLNYHAEMPNRGSEE